MEFSGDRLLSKREASFFTVWQYKLFIVPYPLPLIAACMSRMRSSFLVIHSFFVGRSNSSMACFEAGHRPRLAVRKVSVRTILRACHMEVCTISLFTSLWIKSILSPNTKPCANWFCNRRMTAFCATLPCIS